MKRETTFKDKIHQNHHLIIPINHFQWLKKRQSQKELKKIFKQTKNHHHYQNSKKNNFIQKNI